jgi:CHAD domain-containing protein
LVTVMDSALERELKLDVELGFRLPNLEGERLAPRTLVSVYYDTPDYRLARHGVTVRRRTERRRARWQVKLPHGAARLELELQSPTTEPPTDVRRLLVVYTRGTSLVPIATLRTRRSGVVVRRGKRPVAEVVLDAVSVLKGRRVVRRFREVEVELVGSGTEKDLRRIEVRLRAAGAQDGDGRPKVFRALELDAAAKPRPPGPSDPPVDHVRAMLREQLEAVRAHDPGTRLGKDPEDLHQMRVAVRRSRAILRAARPMFEPGVVDTLREELAWLGTALGHARDVDVLREYLQAELATLPPPERGAGRRLLTLLGETRARARRQLLDQLDDGRRYFGVLDRLGDFVDEPPVVDADLSLRDLAAREFKKLRKVVEALPDDPSDAELHRLRIKTKRARYVAELAAPVVGRPAARFARKARKLQDALGDHRDAVVAERSLRELLAVSRGRQAAFVVGRLAERQRARRRAARKAIAGDWRKLERRGRKAWE